MTNPATTKRQLRVLLIRDEKPGHFNQSYGVVAALGKRLNVQTNQLQLSPVVSSKLVRWFILQRWLPFVIATRLAGIPTLGILKKPDLIISAGGRTLAANVLLAEYFKCPNIFSGSIRGINTDHFSAVLHITPHLENEPKHIVGLKPSVMEPNPSNNRHYPPKQIALLVGGPTATDTFTDGDWEFFAQKMAAGKIRWSIITSRRTPLSWTLIFEGLSKKHSERIQLHDYNKSAVGKVQDLLSKCDAAIISNDSSSMISEAVATGLRSLSLISKVSSPSADDPYFQILKDKNLYREIPIDVADEAQVLEQFKLCQPMTTSHLDILCKRLLEAIPQLKQFQR